MAISPNLSSSPPEAFNPASAVVFDLAEGRVRRAKGQPVVLLAAPVLVQLCSSLDAEQQLKLGNAMGAAAGASVQANHNWTLPQVVEQLGGEISLAGLGSLAMERWGAALVVQVQGCPLGAAGPTVMGGYVEGALQALVGRTVNAVAIETTETSFRLLLCGQAAASRVKQWISSGRSFGDALASLQSPAAQGAN